MPDSRLTEDRLAELIRDGDDLWRRHRDSRGDAFHSFVPADYQGAFEALSNLRGQANSFLELGSGAGVITIIADLLGFEAYGVEIEPWLVDAASELAEHHESDARFATGSFVPTDFDDQELVDPDFHITYDSSESGYAELGLDLDDFDLVYAFPWPGEEALFFEILRSCGRPGGMFLTYGATDGFTLHQVGS